MRSLLIVLMFLPVVGQAQGLDAASEEALTKTQQLLNDRTQREAAVQRNDKAKNADAYARGLIKNDAQGTDDIYKLAAEVFGDMTRQSGGDADAMKKLLDEYQRNPATFANKWTPEQRAMLKKISEKVPVPANSGK